MNIINRIKNFFAKDISHDEDDNMWRFSECVSNDVLDMLKEASMEKEKLKNLFLNYVEHQRNANAIRDAHGVDDKKTIAAYDAANTLKRELLTEIDNL